MKGLLETEDGPFADDTVSYAYHPNGQRKPTGVSFPALLDWMLFNAG